MKSSTLSICLFVLAVTTLAGCGKKTPQGVPPSRATTGAAEDSALTADHDPDMTGRTRRYDWTAYQPDGSVFKKVLFVETYTVNGKRRHRDVNQKAVTVEDYKRRVKGDEVQHAVAYFGSQVWIPQVKIGAKPGSVWKFVPPKGAKVRWTYKEIGSDRGKLCAVILEEYLDGSDVQESWTRWHAKGEGVVRQEYRRKTKSGNFVLDRVFVYHPSEADAILGKERGTGSQPGPGADTVEEKENSGSEYELGYRTGLKQGQEHVNRYKAMNASGKNQFRKTYLGILARFESDCRKIADANGEKHPAAQQKKGNADGYRKALADGGIE
jgi:predicted small lipoprotein YifL